jgi:PhzF family phenazine biosynthesis protein
MEVNIYQVDSFTDQVFKGNPAGVCITGHGLDEPMMLAIAAEMAVSETAFLALDSMRLRWFTPETEVRLCGHGTLAAAHILQQLGRYSRGDSIAFHTLSGVLTAELDENCIHITLPAPELNMRAEINPELIKLLGIAPQHIVDYAGFDIKQLIVIDSEALLTELKPDFSGMTKLAGRGVLVTAKATKVDVVSRYFAPWVGVNEDPVTGSAHCALAVYWAEKLNKTRLRAFQCSRRGGFVDVELLHNGAVKLSGQAVTVLQGKMTIA